MAAHIPAPPLRTQGPHQKRAKGFLASEQFDYHPVGSTNPSPFAKDTVVYLPESLAKNEFVTEGIVPIYLDAKNIVTTIEELAKSKSASKAMLIDRRCWKETDQAIRALLAAEPAPHDEVLIWDRCLLERLPCVDEGYDSPRNRAIVASMLAEHIFGAVAAARMSREEHRRLQERIDVCALMRERFESMCLDSPYEVRPDEVRPDEVRPDEVRPDEAGPASTTVEDPPLFDWRESDDPAEALETDGVMERAVFHHSESAEEAGLGSYSIFSTLGSKAAEERVAPMVARWFSSARPAP